MNFITVLTNEEGEVLVNLDNVKHIKRSVRHRIMADGTLIDDEKCIVFTFNDPYANTCTVSCEYSPETWENIISFIKNTQKDQGIKFPKPLDVKVVNK